MVEAQLLPIQQVVDDGSDQWLNRPDGGDDADVHPADVREIHRHEYWTHDSEEKAAHPYKKKQMLPIQLSVDNDVVTVPDVGDVRISVISEALCQLVDHARHPRPETHVENARQAVYVLSHDTDDDVRGTEAAGCSDGW